MSSRLVVAGALALVSLVSPAAQQAPRDPLAVRAGAASSGTGRLHTVTISTGDLGGSLRFYRDGMGMRVRGPLAVTDSVRTAERSLWGLPANARWTEYLLDRPSVPWAVHIRLLAFDNPGGQIRDSHDVRQPGPFTLGFPTTDAPRWAAALAALGYESLAPLESYFIPRPDGTRYGVDEVIVKAPDFVHAVLIARKDGMDPVGPVEASTGRGGPAYSAQSITGSDEVLRFFSGPLGLDLRSDREWTSNAGSALGIGAGVPFRFSIFYPPGEATGHLLFMDFRKGATAPTAIPPRLPARGIAMWTLPVSDLETVLARLQAAQARVVAGPVALETPTLGAHRAATVLAPNGFLVELVQFVGLR